MKIGVVSDTHRNKEYLQKAVDWMTGKQKITALYHLGDDFDDLGDMSDRYIEVVQVPGVYDERYKNKTIPIKVFESVLGLTILLVHSLEKDVTDEEIRKSDIILYGHTHREEIRLEDGRLFCNPGHLKGPLDKNMPPTFALINIYDRNVAVMIYDMQFKPVKSVELIRSESGLYKVT